MRIGITGFYGWGNSGDEGILLSIIESLGYDNEYIINTSLPFNLAYDYKWKLPLCVEEVRHLHDARMDYDIYLLGGGGLGWGYGWRQCFSIFSNSIPCMNYGVGYDKTSLFNDKLKPVYGSFLNNFDAITIRDESSFNLLKEIGVDSILSMCPAINLEVEKFNCAKGMIAVCPRYEDYIDNDAQIKWIVDRLEGIGDEVMLIPFAPYNIEGNMVDLDLCYEIKSQVPGSRILKIDGFSPRKIKYLISKSKLLISGGRYHALVWAASHNIPFEASPTCINNYPKIGAFIEMHKKHGDLKNLENKNKEGFLKIVNSIKEGE